MKTLDSDFQEKLSQLLRKPRNVYITIGHGEINDLENDTSQASQDSGRSAKSLKMLLGKMGYTFTNLGVTRGLATDVPFDADLLMILGPSRPFAAEELAAVERYARRGGKLLLALDPEAISTGEVDASRAGKTDKRASAAGSNTSATLHALAHMVGVQFSPVLLVNDKEFLRWRNKDSDRMWLVSNRFSSHPSVAMLSRNSSRATVVVAGAGSVQRAQDSTATVDIALRASASTFQDYNRDYVLDGQEHRDSYGIGAAVSLPVAAPKRLSHSESKGSEKTAFPNAPAPDEMRAFVLSDADALTDRVMTNSSSNLLLVADAVRWLGGEENMGPKPSATGLSVEERTRAEESGSGPGETELWGGTPDQVQLVRYECELGELTLEPRQDKTGRYFVGTVKKNVSAADHVTTTSQFITTKGGEYLVNRLAPLKALRELGNVPDAQKADFGFVR